ncbi:MAG: histidinol dehydrogenase [Deltaproteobacteria bacterium]|nr:histidinol dehydrogenase [Deltaproteobacteria bacterium]
MKIYSYPSSSAEKRLSVIEGRVQSFNQKDQRAVARILEDVRKHGDTALINYANRFDSPGLNIETLRAGIQEYEDAASLVTPEFIKSLDRAASQIESFHRKQSLKSWFDTPRSGTLLGQIVNPVNAAGIYVPGGKAGKTPLVSTVLMCAIPARIAGVSTLVMTTPSTPDGTVNPHLLVAARRVGIDAVYKVGSAWAIAAMAYGTGTVPKCDVIVGPGNIYVTLAKKMVAGTVGIDMIAGPSEILIIADESANPEYTAADLLSQAEHDPMASAILVTPSRKVAKQVAEAVSRQMTELTRQDIAEASLKNYGAILVVEDIASAFDLSNAIAPEHLELHLNSPLEYIDRIRNAGAVFMGHYTPEPVGDYIAGPNHVLPTSGTARFSSALSVDHFVKKTSLIHYSETAFRQEAPDIIRLAEIEGLGAHARSVRVRMT